jgi:hypothetical protein
LAGAKCKSGHCAGGHCGGILGRGGNGPCGDFRFAYLGREKFLYSDGSCGAGHGTPETGTQPAAAAQATATAPAPATAPATPPTPATQPATDPGSQQSTSYKKDADAVAAAMTSPKLPTSNRMTTYRPDAIAPTMPVLSPDQFRKPKK